MFTVLPGLPLEEVFLLSVIFANHAYNDAYKKRVTIITHFKKINVSFAELNIWFVIKGCTKNIFVDRTFLPRT